MKALLCASLAVLLSVPALAATGDPPGSLYHLEAQLTNQAGERHGLDVHRGEPVLVTMFYGSCRMTCPLLIETVRAVERSTPEPQRTRLRVLMISLDPEHDTPDALAKLARERRIDTSRWTLARADEATVRKIAALLNVRYRRLPDGGYNHSSSVTLLAPNGEIAAQSAVLGRSDDALVEAIRTLEVPE